MTAASNPSTNADVPKPEADPRPIVALPRAGLSGAAIAAVAIMIAVILFLILDGQRRRSQSARLVPAVTPDSAFAPPPPLIVPPESLPTPAVGIVTTLLPPPPPALPRADPSPPDRRPAPYTPPILVPAAPQAPLVPPVVVGRSDEPALVIDGGIEARRGGSAEPAASRPGSTAGGGSGGTSSDDSPARAAPIGNQSTTMPIGTVIPAVLETPIDTARPGLLRAIVSQDARGFDGRRVLVPRGSRLIGEYQADVRPHQNRVLVTWTRLIRPDGVAIRLASPASDPLGGAGVPGHLHSYFLERFAGAVLQSALSVGVNLASRPGNNSVIVGLPGTTVNNVLGQTSPSTNAPQPKITARQGVALTVFVARDLDFSGVPSRP